MIICTNCGSSNKDDNQICRKCGALLPVSDKPPRIRLSSGKKDRKAAKSKKAVIKPPKMDKPNYFELQEIPKNESMPSEKVISHETPISPEGKVTINIDQSAKEYNDEGTREILKEITPKPFKGSIIASKSVFNSAIEKKIETIPKTKQSQTEVSLLKQKKLEEDMTKVLKFLSKKITVKKLPSEDKPLIEEKKEKMIPPSSMNEILKELLKLDLHIEASAIIRKDGTILASAISSRISDSLFATIGQNLSMIGSDIINGLSAGRLTNISVRGTNGVLDLAPIDVESPLGKDMVLIILSNPRVKSGIINFAAKIVKKQVKAYLGISKQQID